MSLRKAVDLDPNPSDAFYVLAMAFVETEKLDDAISALEQAIRLNPDLIAARNGLSFAMVSQGRQDEALLECRSAVQTQPDYAGVYTSLLFAAYHHTEFDSHELLDLIRPWAKWQNGTASSPLLGRDRNPDRRLKVGYLSPFFF